MSRVTLAVLNIGWTCTKNDLRTYFKKFGIVNRIHIPIYKDTGFNKGVAFVRMGGAKGFHENIMQDYHVIDGYEVTVNLPKQRGGDSTG